MAIDSVGGGSRDGQYETRRRLLEEQRARELDRIEKRHKEQVTQVQDARENALRDIYENQTTEVEGNRAQADARIAQAKAVADNRIKDYEQETMRMTDEAKRQFQSKADLLARNSHEMEQQREFLIKQHTDSMKKLKEEREEARFKQDFKLKQEAGVAYESHKRDLTNLQTRASEELSDLQTNIRANKDRVRNDGQFEIEHLKREKDETIGSISRELDEQKRIGAAQSERERIAKSVTKSTEQEKFDNELSDIRRRAQTSVGRAHRDGQKLLEDVKEVYKTQATQMSADANSKSKNQALQSNAALKSMETNQKLEQKLARDGFEHQKQIMSERREDYLQKATAETTKLQESINQNYRSAAKQVEKSRQDALNQKIDQTQKDLAFRRTQGDRQLAALSEANSKAVASHASKSSDPFYRLQTLDAEVANGDTEYVVRIRVPDHEKDTVRLTLQHDGVCVSGSRRFEDRIKTDDGRKVTTNAFQSYSETFPVSGKLEMKRMTRLYDNGTLTFRIPKG